MTLTVIAKLRAKPGQEEILLEACHKLIEPTRKEEGCINYDMFRSTDDPGTFMFYENWESRPLWEQHMKSPHLTAFSSQTDGMSDLWELFTGDAVTP